MDRAAAAAGLSTPTRAPPQGRGERTANRTRSGGAGAHPSASFADASRTGLTVVVTARRSQWATREMFAWLGLSMTGFDVVSP